MMFVELRKVAQFLDVSGRRVRTLLAQGRIIGHKNSDGHWMVTWPLDVIPGKRGPDLKRFPARPIFTPPKTASRSRRGRGQASKAKSGTV